MVFSVFSIVAELNGKIYVVECPICVFLSRSYGIAAHESDQVNSNTELSASLHECFLKMIMVPIADIHSRGNHP